MGGCNSPHLAHFRQGTESIGGAQPLKTIAAHYNAPQLASHGRNVILCHVLNG
jgi:hypothetical protein